MMAAQISRPPYTVRYLGPVTRMPELRAYDVMDGDRLVGVIHVARGGTSKTLYRSWTLTQSGSQIYRSDSLAEATDWIIAYDKERNQHGADR
jgi:hypothetical protein